jgi:hypothetical protein
LAHPLPSRALSASSDFDNPVWPTLIFRFGPPLPLLVLVSFSLFLFLLRDFNRPVFSPGAR